MAGAWRVIESGLTRKNYVALVNKQEINFIVLSTDIWGDY